MEPAGIRRLVSTRWVRLSRMRMASDAVPCLQGGELTRGQAAFGFEPEIAQVRPLGQCA